MRPPPTSTQTKNFLLPRKILYPTSLMSSGTHCAIAAKHVYPDQTGADGLGTSWARTCKVADGARGDFGELAPAARCLSLSAASRALP